MKLIDKIAYRTSIDAGRAYSDVLEYSDTVFVRKFKESDFAPALRYSKETWDDYVKKLSELCELEEPYPFYDGEPAWLHCIKMTRAIFYMRILEKRLTEKK